MSDAYVSQTVRTSVQLMAWFAKANGRGIGKTKLMKLVYISERHRVRNSGLSITDDKLSAMPQGPVLSGALNLLNPAKRTKTLDAYFSKYLDVVPVGRSLSIRAKAVDEDEFSENDLISIRWAWKNFGHYTMEQIVNITHKFPEWESKGDVEKTGSSKPIKYEDMLEDAENDACKIFGKLNSERKRELIEELSEHRKIKAALAAR